MGPFTSLLSKYVVNGLIQAKNGSFALLLFAVGFRVGNFIIMGVMPNFLIKLINHRLEQTTKGDVVKKMFESILDRSTLFFYETMPGQLAERIIQVSGGIQKIVHLIGPQFLISIIQLTAVIVITYFTNPLFCYIFIVFIILYGALSVYASKKIVILSQSHGTKESIVSGNLVDCLTNINSVTTLCTQNYEIEILTKFLTAKVKTFRSRQKLEIIFYLIQGAMILIMMLLVSMKLIQLYKADLITAGDFSLILTISLGLSSAILDSLTLFNRLSEEIGVCNQGLSVLGPTKDGTVDLGTVNGTIVFNKVKFGYKDTGLIFKDLSFRIESGQKVGLVGFSGSGKSTCVNLILRLFDISSGSISIDGYDISNVTMQSLLTNIGYVPQNPSLFQRSIMENLKYGKLDATDEEVIKISKTIGLHDVIMKLPEQYQTKVTNFKMSGGEKQRVGLVRTLLRNSPILIFDEAMSQLDNITERELQKLILNLSANKTCIFITHRLTSMELFDNILVFSNGKIVETGKHVDLIKKNGVYANLAEQAQ